MQEKLNQFYLNQKEPYQSCFLALREIILSFYEEIHETIKYGMPCFCFRNKNLCYLWSDKESKEPYILFVEGNQLHHPLLEKGNRKRMKIFRVNPIQDLDRINIQRILEESIAYLKTKNLSN